MCRFFKVTSTLVLPTSQNFDRKTKSWPETARNCVRPDKTELNLSQNYQKVLQAKGPNFLAVQFFILKNRKMSALNSILIH
jgi:hypothetical protein